MSRIKDSQSIAEAPQNFLRPEVMSDDEHHDVHFESADSGASTTFPQQAGTVRKNGFLVIKGRPCKVCLTTALSKKFLQLLPGAIPLTACLPHQVADVSTSKTGKHGHAKCHFVAIDIFTGKKYEDLTPCVPPGFTP